MPSPLEEQVEKLAWEWGESAKQLEALARSGGDEESAAWVAGASAAREEDIDDLRALLPLEVTDEMVEAGAKALGEWGGSAMPGTPLNRELSRACLSAALTQPQTEKCPNPDCEGGTRPNGEGGWDLCPDCLEAADAAGGGAATPRGVADADLVTVKPPKPSVDENHGEVAMWARRMARHLGLDGEDGPSLEPYARAFLQAIQLADHRLMDTRDSDEPTDKEQV